MSKQNLAVLIAGLAAAAAPAAAHVPLPGEVPDAERLTLAGVFANAGVPMKVVLFGLVLAVLAALLVWALQLARRTDRPSAYLSGLSAAAPLFGFFGAFYAILSGCIGIANVRPTPTLTILAPGLAEAALSAGLGLLAAAIAVSADRHLKARRPRAEPMLAPVTEARPPTGQLRAAI